jgi:hypothetical protein
MGRKMYNSAELEKAIPIGSQPTSQRSSILLSPVVTVCTDTCSNTGGRLHIDAPCICGFRMIHADNFYN